jgi:glycosyltransferase involved in cell wall biosynthesis
LKVEHISLQFDQLIRSLGARELEKSAAASKIFKPIMVIIPAYNEAENLREVLTRIPKHIKGVDVGVLVVDDGSQDNTADVAYELGHLVVSNRINRGQGAASRLGYDVLIKNNVSVGVTMDADGQHRPEELATLVTPILDEQYDLVIGSRVLGKSHKNTWIRNLGIILLSRVISMVIPQKITDCSSGFKAFNISKLRDMNLTEAQFQSAEVLIEASKKGLRIGEVPVTINRRKYGSSKTGTNWSYGLNFAKTILKTWWR